MLYEYSTQTWRHLLQIYGHCWSFVATPIPSYITHGSGCHVCVGTLYFCGIEYQQMSPVLSHSTKSTFPLSLWNSWRRGIFWINFQKLSALYHTLCLLFLFNNETFNTTQFYSTFGPYPLLAKKKKHYFHIRSLVHSISTRPISMWQWGQIQVKLILDISHEITLVNKWMFHYWHHFRSSNLFDSWWLFVKNMPSYWYRNFHYTSSWKFPDTICEHMVKSKISSFDLSCKFSNIFSDMDFLNLFGVTSLVQTRR